VPQDGRRGKYKELEVTGSKGRKFILVKAMMGGEERETTELL